MKKNMLILILAGIISGALPRYKEVQSCGCAVDECCSQMGYCGTGYVFCGVGCQEGPCYSFLPANNLSVADIVTPKFFNGIHDQAAASCAGKKFYTRAAFLKALNSFLEFGRIGMLDDSRREIAAFFAHVTHEIGYFCYIEEIDGHSKNYCNKTYTQSYPCNPNKSYYGRGPIQLSWNFNYGPARNEIGFDGLNSPETVAKDPVISFKTSLWYWMNFVHRVIGQGFGETIQVINYHECDGANSARVERLVTYYTQYCNQLGVVPGDNLTCS
ncbi:endochitinase EP3-like [Corylus avellana]|uniref:endochitinase EP3-like n=1 Tax=Corylus avellana TaxID=13451 RepID=UPI00286C99FE|nr:endochitinase EP3-like [Corylus avellana]